MVVWNVKVRNYKLSLRRLVPGPPDPPSKTQAIRNVRGLILWGVPPITEIPSAREAWQNQWNLYNSRFSGKRGFHYSLKHPPPKSQKTSSETWKLSIWPNISGPTTLKRTQCSGRQHQSVLIYLQAQWNRNMRNCPPLGVFSSPPQITAHGH